MSKLTDAPNFFIGRSEAIAQNDKLSNKARQSLYTARAANTVDAYRSDWNDFCDWCSYHQLSSFPAEPETIVNYINDLADNAKANTIARRISALTENFDAAGLKENPCRYPIVKNALRGIKRMKGTIQHGKAPILFDDIKEMLGGEDGIPHTGMDERSWNSEKHAYGWFNGEGDYYVLYFVPRDGDEFYTAATFSSSVRGDS